jgi:hypothetical protein
VSSAASSTKVLIVSRNEETARNLQHYFESRSLLVTVTTRLGATKGDATPTALVIFPDEFPKGEAERGLLELAQHYPSASMTVVTADTQRFADLGGRLDENAHRRLLVLPRPAFSWTIFDHVIAPCTADDTTRGF